MATVSLNDQSYRVGNIFCVARNYVAHAKEMGSQILAEPVVFLKPTSAVLHEGEPIRLPSWSNDVHHEAELVVLIGEGGRDIQTADALQHVAGYALGLDLTARDVQAEAKKAGMPWTLAKGFDGAAVLSRFVPADALPQPGTVSFDFYINDERRQHAETRDMAFDVATLIAWISSRFTLQAGDLIYTGTPEGVGPIRAGEHLRLVLGDLIDARFEVV
ncbi:fumarylacetoacetate hydrolase family protein [Jeongeupia naejangsanensis]|uniref:Fumarylacetoacetate hydrolase family protein n=1 Tax=Jeongeupia naejangsanensis TaxID=613195 RepID=A0ABS2BQF4_9NEIS|nr:fumarylacetoacetate hydrolase family protein [Jeongeupia naejangsanensis]MBM3117808.1 fumarylacetoacetate hydrolase family protein [Jeongeupia naejangsanensis]